MFSSSFPTNLANEIGIISVYIQKFWGVNNVRGPVAPVRNQKGLYIHDSHLICSLVSCVDGETVTVNRVVLKGCMVQVRRREGVK